MIVDLVIAAVTKHETIHIAHGRITVRINVVLEFDAVHVVVQSVFVPLINTFLVQLH